MDHEFFEFAKFIGLALRIMLVDQELAFLPFDMSSDEFVVVVIEMKGVHVGLGVAPLSLDIYLVRFFREVRRVNQRHREFLDIIQRLVSHDSVDLVLLSDSNLFLSYFGLIVRIDFLSFQYVLELDTGDF